MIRVGKFTMFLAELPNHECGKTQISLADRLFRHFVRVAQTCGKKTIATLIPQSPFKIELLADSQKKTLSEEGVKQKGMSNSIHQEYW